MTDEGCRAAAMAVTALASGLLEAGPYSMGSRDVARFHRVLHNAAVAGGLIRDVALACEVLMAVESEPADRAARVLLRRSLDRLNAALVFAG